MYRKRLREKYTDEELGRIYSIPHDHRRWKDHEIRVRQTIALGSEATMPAANGAIVDLSCGNGMIARALADHFNGIPILGDYAYKAGYIHGPIEQTIKMLSQGIDLFICSETVEHLDDPETVLRDIRSRSKQLLLSTPIAEGRDFEVNNPEHYWGWDQKSVKALLENAGWRPVLRTDLHFTDLNFPYNYQIWLCQ